MQTNLNITNIMQMPWLHSLKLVLLTQLLCTNNFTNVKLQVDNKLTCDHLINSPYHSTWHMKILRFTFYTFQNFRRSYPKINWSYELFMRTSNNCWRIFSVFNVFLILNLLVFVITSKLQFTMAYVICLSNFRILLLRK